MTIIAASAAGMVGRRGGRRDCRFQSPCRESCAVGEMNTEQVQHFRMVRALVSGLDCSGYNSRQWLAEDSKLACTAGRHKIDTAKVSGGLAGALANTEENDSTRELN